MSLVRVTPANRLLQGDIVRDVEYIEYAVETHGIVEVSRITFPLVVVLTQDCDLEQDHKFRGRGTGTTTQDKWLLSVLVAPLYNAEHVYLGEHLSDLDMTMEPINRQKTPGKMMRSNERQRYHYLEFPSKIPIVPSVVDFKHYFAINVQTLHALRPTHFVCRLAPLFREAISQRFANYLARIGLPEGT